MSEQKKQELQAPRKNFITSGLIRIQQAVKNPEDQALTPREIIEAPGIRQAEDRGAVMVVIFEMVKKTLMALGNNPTDEMSELFTEEIYHLSKYESIYDIHLILENGRRGKYGKIYGNFSLGTYTDWYKQYMDHKASLREREVHNKKFDDPGELSDHPGLMKIYANFQEKPEAKKTEKVPANENYFNDRKNQETLLRGEMIQEQSKKSKSK